MATVTTGALLGIGGLFDIIGTTERIRSAEEQNRLRQQAIDDRIREEKIAANNKALQRQDQLEKVVSAQEARIGASGLAPSSASFRAIETNTFDEFAKDQKADNLTLKFNELGLDEQREQFNDEEKYQIEGDIFQGASSLFDKALWGSMNLGGHDKFINNFGDTTGRELPTPGGPGAGEGEFSGGFL